MVIIGNAEGKEEIQEELRTGTASNIYGDKDRAPLSIQEPQNEKLDEKHQRNRFLDMVTNLPIRSGYTKFNSSSILSSPSAKFYQFAEKQEEISRSVTSPKEKSSSRRFPVHFVRKINWSLLKDMSKKWIKNPLNMALFIWIICVAVSGAILFMVMTGMLNKALPKKSQRDVWFEVNNQILNALFTLMCLYQHPKRFHHLALLCRWRPEDVLQLRKIYCKNGSYKPHEWMHMMVVVVLLHINCFAQYALCGLNLGYPRSRRPAIGVGLCISVAIGAPVVAAVYNILSPLGKDYEIETDEEAPSQQAQTGFMSPEKRYSFAIREDGRILERRPLWAGGLFDLWDDISLAYLSLFCSFCVFGWNMDRLGFGNMYVHIVTFVLLCMAPFWIFNLAAINIDNETIRETLGFTGIVLCVFGLLYGGFWRIQMRKRYNLPANRFCCGNPAITDCFQWLCCCFCSLAQEVRTADFYEVVEDKFYSKQTPDSTMSVNVMSPLPREDSSPLFRSGPSSPLWTNSTLLLVKASTAPGSLQSHAEDLKLATVKEDSSLRGTDTVTAPPTPLLIQRENNQTP